MSGLSEGCPDGPDLNATKATINAKLGRRPGDSGYGSVKRAPQRRIAVELVTGHLKAEHRMGRNYLARRGGDAANTVLAAVE